MIIHESNCNGAPAHEVDNLGFNIYREQDGERTRVNRQIIAGSALLVGAGTTLRAGRAYAWWDNSGPFASDGRTILAGSDRPGEGMYVARSRLHRVILNGSRAVALGRLPGTSRAAEQLGPRSDSPALGRPA